MCTDDSFLRSTVRKGEELGGKKLGSSCDGGANIDGITSVDDALLAHTVREETVNNAVLHVLRRGDESRDLLDCLEVLVARGCGVGDCECECLKLVDVLLGQSEDESHSTLGQSRGSQRPFFGKQISSKHWDSGSCGYANRRRDDG